MISLKQVIIVGALLFISAVAVAQTDPWGQYDYNSPPSVVFPPMYSPPPENKVNCGAVAQCFFATNGCWSRLDRETQKKTLADYQRECGPPLQ